MAGEIPQHLLKLHHELGQVSLNKKNEGLVLNMMKNFGETAQELQYVKLPDISKQINFLERSNSY